MASQTLCTPACYGMHGWRCNFQRRTVPAKLKSMRCRYCDAPAGWWRRRCRCCRRLSDVFAAHRGADMGRLMDLFIATGAPRGTIEKFLSAAPGRGATIRDQIAADMTNDLLAAMGRRAEQSAADVERIRKRGNWMGLDKRPRE